VSEDILTDAERRDLAHYAGVSAGPSLDDAALLGVVAEKIGLEGEMAVDPDGILELERGDVLVVLETVSDDDVDHVDRPDLLHLGVYLRTGSDADRSALEEAGLLEPASPGDGADVEAGWSLAWWGAACTTLPRDAALPARMEALHRVMNSAEAVLARGELGSFFEELDSLLLDEDDD
jgi:hypothetical protein